MGGLSLQKEKESMRDFFKFFLPPNGFMTRVQEEEQVK